MREVIVKITRDSVPSKAVWISPKYIIKTSRCNNYWSDETGFLEFPTTYCEYRTDGKTFRSLGNGEQVSDELQEEIEGKIWLYNNDADYRRRVS